MPYNKPIERKQWINIKHRYIYTDATYDQIANDISRSRQTIMAGLRREFPKVDWKVRKEEERLKRETKNVAKIKEQGDIQRIKRQDSLDDVDDRHLDLINGLLDQAFLECENGTLKAKSIKDIMELINMERTIKNKRTTNDRVITIKAEKPEGYEELPEIVDAEFEEIKEPSEEG